MSAHNPQSPQPGAGAPQILGGFRLIEPLGRGGMGEVWRAEREGPGGFRRRAAVKRILPRFQSDPTLRARFLAEARINARLEHPNIAQVLDFGESPEPFLALEYIEGTTVAKVLKVCAETQQRLPFPAVAYILAELATGLDYAHRRKDDAGNPLMIVHRDVSPQNVLISTDGAVKISDFGVARAADNQLRTQQGIAVGKLAYMAPEQASGGQVDWRADVFALGVLLWESLLVRPLIPRNDSNAAIQLLMSGRFEPPSRLDPRVPPQLDAAVMEALQVDPNRRTQSAGLLAQQLRAFLHATAPGFDGAALVRALAPIVRDVPWQIAGRSDAHPSLGEAEESSTRMMSAPSAARPARPATMAPPTRNDPMPGAVAPVAPPAAFPGGAPQSLVPQGVAPPMGMGPMPPSPPSPMGMGAMPPSPMGMGAMSPSPMGMGAMPPSPMGMGAMPPSPMGMGAMPPSPMVAPAVVSTASAAVPMTAPAGPKPLPMKWITLAIVLVMVGGAGALFIYLTRSSMAPRGTSQGGPVVSVGAADAGAVAPPPREAPVPVAQDAGAPPVAVDFGARATAALVALDPPVRACLAAERSAPEWTDLNAVFDNVTGTVAEAAVTFRGARNDTARLRACVLNAARGARFATAPGATGTTRAMRSWPGRAPRSTGGSSGPGIGFEFPFGRAH